MVSTIRVESVGDRPVVVKRASGPEGERLRREGERLERASHPGVVPLVQHGATDDGWELRTLHAGRPASACGPLTVAQVASLAAGVASTLADLHDVGIVHGRLDASHVLVGDHGRPVLCGFGDGEPPARPADDVAALGALLDRWLGTDDAGEPIPERRWWGRRGWDGWDRRALLLLADQAVADPPTCRPTARRLAAAIADAVPDGARLDARPAMTAGGPAHLDPIERLRATAPFEIPVAWAAARKGLVAGRRVGGPSGRRRCGATPRRAAIVRAIPPHGDAVRHHGSGSRSRCAPGAPSRARGWRPVAVATGSARWGMRC